MVRREFQENNEKQGIAGEGMDDKGNLIKKAVFIARKTMAGHVFSFQTMENMPFTLPEVQTYMQGITVGGHKVSDEEKLKQQVIAWEHLIQLVETGTFQFSKKVACELQEIVAKDEAAECGVFRRGFVSVSGRETPLPRFQDLDSLFKKLCNRIEKTKNVLKSGFIVSLDVANNQYFYDGNKRTGILLMNGILMSNGYMPISIPAKSMLEYNTKMLSYYNSGDELEMLDFLTNLYEKAYPDA